MYSEFRIKELRDSGLKNQEDTTVFLHAPANYIVPNNNSYQIINIMTDCDKD